MIMDKKVNLFQTLIDPGFNTISPTVDPGKISWMHIVSYEPDKRKRCCKFHMKAISPA
jgi:hypothetical protein